MTALTHTHTHTHTLTHSRTLTHTLTLTLTHTHSQKHTHTLTLSHTHTHTRARRLLVMFRRIKVKFTNNLNPMIRSVLPDKTSVYFKNKQTPQINYMAGVKKLKTDFFI